MQRIRITIKIDTDMTREQFNRAIKNTVPIFVKAYGNLVYLATEMPEPATIMHDTTEQPPAMAMSQRLR